MQTTRGTSLTNGPKRLSQGFVGLVLGLGLIGWAIDQATKVWAERALADRDPVEVIGSLLRFTLVRNPGAAFSAGTGITPVITLVALTVFLGVLVMAFRVADRRWAIALGLLLAGVSGNLTDRIFRDPGPLRGHVVDFLQLPNWPVFNIADIWINIAAVLIVLLSIRNIPFGVQAGPEGQAGPEEPAEPEERVDGAVDRPSSGEDGR